MSLQAEVHEHCRRDFMTSTASGLGLTALTALLSEEWLRSGGGRLQAAQPFADSSATASPTQLANALAEKLPHFASLRNVFENLRPRPNLPYYTLISEVIQRYVNSVLCGKTTASEALLEAEKEAKKIIEKYDQK